MPQTLALYGTFLIVRRLPGGDRMAAFTRILHRAAADELSPYVPTVRVDPLHPACDEPMGLRCPYVQADRPAAVRAFLDRARREPGLIQVPPLHGPQTRARIPTLAWTPPLPPRHAPCLAQCTCIVAVPAALWRALWAPAPLLPLTCVPLLPSLRAHHPRPRCRRPGCSL